LLLAAVLTAGGTAAAQSPYIITGSGTEFTATLGNVTVGTADQPIQDVIDAIKTEADGNPCTIQFGDGGTLDIGTANIRFDGTASVWGLITLTGRITSANNNNTNSNRGTLFLSGGASIESVADIGNSATGPNGRAIYNYSTGTVTINGGTVSATTGIAIHNYAGGTVNISDGAVKSDYIGIENSSSGKINISGGTVSVTGGSGLYAVNQSSTGVLGTINISGGTVSATSGIAVRPYIYAAVNISGGTVSATTGTAVVGGYGGKVTVSGTALVTSANATNSTTTSIYQGTICLSLNNATDAVSEPLEITGGTVENTAANGRAVYNACYGGAVKISGGTISTAADTDFAVYTTVNGSVVLGGSPNINGIIKVMIEKLSVDRTINPFSPAPASRVYKIAVDSCVTGKAIVKGGAGNIANFELHKQPYYKLEEVGGDIAAVWTGPSDRYVIIDGETEFTATLNGFPVGRVNRQIQDVIDAIKTDANGNPCTIQFGDGGTLDIGSAVVFDGGTPGTDWGLITLTGKASSINIRLNGGTSINSYAELSSSSQQTIYNTSNGTVSISGGIVSAASGGEAILSNGGDVNISGTAEITSAMSSAISMNNGSNGKFTMTGGRVTSTSVATIAFNTTGYSVTISGGYISSQNGRAIEYIRNNNSTVISGDAEITSANPGTGLYNGTIYIGYDHSLTMTGGLVSNTSTTGNAISSYPVGSAVNISGGTVSAAGGVAIYSGYSPVNISGIAEITSANAAANSGTIFTAYASNLTMTGGAVMNTAATGNAIYQAAQSLESRKFISGGTVSASNGSAIYSGQHSDSIVISGSAVVTSANTSAASGTIHIAPPNPGSYSYATIIGGTVSNTTATGNAVYSNSSAGTGYIELSGAPNIAGMINYSPATLSVASTFNPGARVYTLDLQSYPNPATAVQNGAAFIDNFELYNQPTRALVVSGAHLDAVEKSDYDMSGVTFPGATVTYDGNPHSINISGTLPAGVTVSYTGNNQTNVGAYTVTATFAVVDAANYNVPTSMTATLTIDKGDHNMAGVTFPDAAFSYDGNPKSISINGALPTGVTVSYTGNNQTAVGTYTVTATFVVSDAANYNVPTSMAATLEINNKTDYDMSGIAFTGASVTYNSSPHSINISGTLPAGVSVSYTGNNQTAVGTYTVTATFVVSDAANYNVPASMTATLTINKASYNMSGIAFTGVAVTYDGSPHSINISGTLPAGVTVSYTGNNQTAVGTYTVTATFAVADPANYNVPASMTATLTVAAANNNGNNNNANNNNNNVSEVDNGNESANGNTVVAGNTANTAKAAGVFRAHAAVSVAYSPALKLSGVALSSGYAWSNPGTALSAGNNQSFAATYNDPSGNYTQASGRITVNVQALSGVAFISPVSMGAGLGSGEHSDTAYSGEVYTVRVMATDQDGVAVKAAVRVLIAVEIGGMTVPKTITTDAGTGVGEYDLSISGSVAGGRVTVFALTVTDGGETYSDSAELRVEKRVSVLSFGREIPVISFDDGAAAVAPVKALSGGLTAGPNPVGALSAAPVRFFRAGGRIGKAELYVYDAMGNMVKKVNIMDTVSSTNERRVVGSWDLTDRRGRWVSDGTYAVRGTIAAINGKKENVSLLIDVR
jgi:hypothetical protein